jgi:hypothetical protein
MLSRLLFQTLGVLIFALAREILVSEQQVLFRCEMPVLDFDKWCSRFLESDWPMIADKREDLMHVRSSSEVESNVAQVEVSRNRAHNLEVNVLALEGLAIKCGRSELYMLLCTCACNACGSQGG